MVMRAFGAGFGLGLWRGGRGVRGGGGGRGSGFGGLELTFWVFGGVGEKLGGGRRVVVAAEVLRRKVEEGA